MADVLLLGSTDTTITVGEAALCAGLRIWTVVSVGSSFSISYSDRPVLNARSVDIPLWARDHGVRSLQFESYDRVLSELGEVEIPVCLVAGWYHMLPRHFRNRFPHGCIGFHASLLPQLRGGAPLNWAILTGLETTGVTMLQLEDGVDDGPVYGQKSFPISPRTTIADLITASGEACAALVDELLPSILSGSAHPVAQQGAPSYGLQRQPEDGRIQWSSTSESIDRLVRAVGRPYPGAFSYLDGQHISIWRTEQLNNPPRVFGCPGQIARLPDVEFPCVVTGDGIIAVVEATDPTGVCAIRSIKRANQKRFTAE